MFYIVNAIFTGVKWITIKPILSMKDAYFCKASTFTCADSTMIENGEKLAEVVVRASSDTVAFTAPAAKKTPGRPRKYGDKIRPYPLFSCQIDKSWKMTVTKQTNF